MKSQSLTSLAHCVPFPVPGPPTITCHPKANYTKHEHNVHSLLTEFRIPLLVKHRKFICIQIPIKLTCLLIHWIYPLRKCMQTELPNPRRVLVIKKMEVKPVIAITVYKSGWTPLTFGRA